MSSSPKTSESKSSSRGAGFSMKSILLALVFGFFASPANTAMMMPFGAGMDPMMGMGGMPPFGGGNGMPRGMRGDPRMMRAMGYRYRRGRRRGLLGLRRSRGRWVKNRYGMPPMGMGMPPMGMGMPPMGMGMPPMGMGMGMPPMGMGMGRPPMGMGTLDMDNRGLGMTVNPMGPPMAGY